MFWSKSIDILDSFTNWNYKFLSWECYEKNWTTQTNSETKLNKNPNIDESNYSHWIDQSNVNNIITAQNSKLLFWLSENKNILILAWILLFTIWIVIRRRGKRNGEVWNNIKNI